MRAVVQRVSAASVSVDGTEVARIGRGLLVLVGIASGDVAADVETLASRVAHLRIFDDEDGRMNRSVADVGGAVLVVSQFTLMGDARKGRRPAFDAAAPPEDARARYEELVRSIERQGLPVATGIFQARMQVTLTNDGPVTILLDSRRQF